MKPVRPPKLADAVAERLEQMILEGVLRPGDRLASERDLAGRLDVSRPSLRDAISRLEERGLLVSGREGARVARFLDPFTAPLAELLADKARVAADYFEYRRTMEAEAARLAARRATDIDREAIVDILVRMKAAHGEADPAREAAADADLHIAIYEAAHNVVMLHVMRALSQLLRSNVFYNRDRLYRRADARPRLLVQHVAIAESVLSGDAEAAGRASAEHIRFTFETIEDIRRDDERRVTALGRSRRSDVTFGRPGEDTP